MSAPLKAGRGLDALIAEKIFGFSSSAPLSDCLRCADDTVNCVIPHYSTSIEDAWKVVENLTQEPGRYCDLSNSWDGRAATWIARFNGFSATADTAPLAISLAALAASTDRSPEEQK